MLGLTVLASTVATVGILKERNGASDVTTGSRDEVTAAAASAPPVSLEPGTYRYDVAGEQMTESAGVDAVSAEGLLRVDAGVGTEQRLVRTDPTGVTDMTLQYRDDGIYVSRLRLTTSVFDLEFMPEAAPVIQVPAVIGRPWSWSAQSIDAETSLDATFELSRSDVATVAGESKSALVVRAVLKLSGAVDAQLEQLTWHDPADGTVLRQRQSSHGEADGVVFRSDIRWTLTSTTPA